MKTTKFWKCSYFLTKFIVIVSAVVTLKLPNLKQIILVICLMHKKVIWYT